MSFNDIRASVIPPPLHSYSADASGCWSQFPRNDLFDPQSPFDSQQPPFKRARNSEESQSSPMALYPPPLNSRLLPPNAPVNKGISNIFFKTRMCAKFKLGLCRNGANCNFAHGVEDMRQPPPNWQEIVGVREDDQSVVNWNDDQKIIQKMKLCRKFYNGEECPYGDRCNFLHEDPAKFRDDSGRFRESSAISIGTTGATPLMNGSGDSSSYPEPSRVGSCSVSDALRANGNVRPSFWKTKLCTKWEITGHCPFGEKCHFAHGQSELQLYLGREGEASNTALNVKPLVVAMEVSSSLSTGVPSPALPQGQAKLKWKGHKKINRIYADWLDDLPLSPSSASKLEG